jgi:hypothetical protein
MQCLRLTKFLFTILTPSRRRSAGQVSRLLCLTLLARAGPIEQRTAPFLALFVASPYPIITSASAPHGGSKPDDPGLPNF